MRIGILGASRIAELAIVGPAADLGYRLVAVAARDPLRAELFAQKYGVERVLGDYDEVLGDPEVDVVYNPLANSLHGQWNLRAVAAGKPVLSEKPYACNAAEAREVAAASQAAGVLVVEAFHYVYHPVTRRLLEVIGGELGELRELDITMLMPAPADGDPRWSLELGGGALMDLGCYALHFTRTVARMLDEKPEIVAARAVERDPGVDATFEAELRLGDVRVRSVNSMVAQDYHFSIRAVGSLGEAMVHNFVKPHEDDRLTIRTGPGERVARLGTRASYTYQLEAFAAHLRDGLPLPVGNADAVANMELIDEAYRCAGLPPR